MQDELTVILRIALYIVAGRLVAGGWLPEDVAAQLTSPEFVEAVVGIVTGSAVFAWYMFSKARRALKNHDR